MKIICIDNLLNSDTDLWLTVRSDSSVLRNNDDFYMPTFSTDMVANVGYYLRVTRLAKCVNEKFAPRCYDAVGVAVAFSARDIIERNCALGRPCDEAYCFDKSIALSLENIATNEVGEGRLGIKIGEKALSCDLSQIKRSLDGALARASELLTLKMGDIIFISATESEKVAIGENIAVSLNENCLLDFSIK